MILLYSEAPLPVDLPQLVPTCEAADRRIVPLVQGDDLRCLQRALRTAAAAVAIRTSSRLLALLAERLRPDLDIYVWGLPMRRRRIRPMYSGEYRGPGLYLVRSRWWLLQLRGKQVDGLALDAEAFDPHSVERLVKGNLRCDRCGSACGEVDLLLCDAYREVEVL